MASCMALKRAYEHDRDSSTTPNTNRFSSTTPSPSSKRRCFPRTVVSSSPPTSTETTESTVFPDVQPILAADALLVRIKEEVRRLQRRHQLKSSSSQPVATTTASSDLSDDETVQVTDSRPHEHQRLNANQQHLLTLKQVNLICARLLKEREEKIREEYDRILSNKLNEQYEGFVRFTQDQLTRRFSELQFSYVS